MTGFGWQTEHDLLALWQRLLPLRDAQVLQLVFGVGLPDGPLTYHEAASHLHVSIETVKRRRAAALDRLRLSAEAPLLYRLLCGALPRSTRVGRCHLPRAHEAQTSDDVS